MGNFFYLQNPEDFLRNIGSRIPYHYCFNCMKFPLHEAGSRPVRNDSDFVETIEKQVQAPEKGHEEINTL